MLQKIAPVCHLSHCCLEKRTRLFVPEWKPGTDLTGDYLETMDRLHAAEYSDGNYHGFWNRMVVHHTSCCCLSRRQWAVGIIRLFNTMNCSEVGRDLECFPCNSIRTSCSRIPQLMSTYNAGRAGAVDFTVKLRYQKLSSSVKHQLLTPTT